MTNKISAVLFDYGGTLDSDGLHWRERFYSIYKEAGMDAAPEAFDRAFYDSDDNLPKRFRLQGLGLEETVRLQVGCVLDGLNVPRKDFLDRISSVFVESSRRFLRRNRPLLERLRKRYPLGIVSNFYGNLDSILVGEGLDDLFSVVADSELVGAVKPAAQLFLHASVRLGVEPRETLMVGDSVPRDMRGAEGLAMPHAWMSGHRSPREVCCPEAHVLSSLPQLEEILLAKAGTP